MHVANDPVPEDDVFLICQTEHLRVETRRADLAISGSVLRCGVTVTNTGAAKLSQVALCPTNTPAAAPIHLTKSLKPGAHLTA